jgi:hypothetical protein
LSWLRALAVSGTMAAAAGGLAPGVAGASVRYRTGPITDISAACAGQNAEVEQAVDPARGYVYEEWMGCGGAIAFARSTNGGRTFGTPIVLPGSTGSNAGSWDPSLAVAPNGTVYAAFMTGGPGDRVFPVVDASFDQGASFPQSTSLTPAETHNWGDRDFIAVGPNGTVYVTWDYGPSAAAVTFICAANGSCSFATGDLNVVMQTSTNGGRTFGPMSHISPGFPASGADSAPLVVEPSGRIDVLYQGYSYTDLSTLTLGGAYSYFTASGDGGRTWAAPVRVGAQAGTMNTSEWWIDGAIARDAGGNLYATWDTQGTDATGKADDVGWLSYSTDHGATWSAPFQAPSDRRDAPHIVEVAGGPAGTAYVGWLSNGNPLGYALYLRTFSVTGGWRTAPTQISKLFGESSVWPGDTFGISTLSPTRLELSWGSATRATDNRSEIYATSVGVG